MFPESSPGRLHHLPNLLAHLKNSGGWYLPHDDHSRREHHFWTVTHTQCAQWSEVCRWLQDIKFILQCKRRNVDSQWEQKEFTKTAQCCRNREVDKIWGHQRAAHCIKPTLYLQGKARLAAKWNLQICLDTCFKVAPAKIFISSTVLLLTYGNSTTCPPAEGISEPWLQRWIGTCRWKPTAEVMDSQQDYGSGHWKSTFQICYTLSSESCRKELKSELLR